jgi:hypothetical protein
LIMDKLTPIDSGGIILSYQCNSACRHCLYAAAPDWDDWMDVQDAGLIFQGLLKTCRHLRGFHIAGGEPFLDFGRLLRVQRLATEFGIPIEYVETNASWCIDEATAKDKFSQLRDAGLGCVLVSSSPFHAEHIALNRISTAVKVGYDIFGPGGVILWIPEFYRQLSAIRTDLPIPLKEYVDSVGEGTARYLIRSGYSLITGGRLGYEMDDFYEKRPPERCAGDHCRMEILESGHAHFDPYGNFVPSFCSGITLGDARDLPALTEGLDLDRSPLLRILVDQGPYALYEFAEKEFGYKPLPDGYIGKCHLCVDVRRFIRRHTDEFAELSPGQFYEHLELPKHTRPRRQM